MRDIVSAEKFSDALNEGAKEYLAGQKKLNFFKNEAGQWRAYNVLLYLNELKLANFNKPQYLQHLLALTFAIWTSGSVELVERIAHKLITGKYTYCNTHTSHTEHNTLASNVFSSYLLKRSLEFPSTLRCDGADDLTMIMSYRKDTGALEILTILADRMSIFERNAFERHIADYKKALSIRHRNPDRDIHLSHEMRWINP